MTGGRRRRGWTVAGLLLLAGVLGGSGASAFEDARGELTATRTCEAYVSFRKLTNPDDRHLVQGTRYQVLGRNRADGEWLQLLLPDAEPRQRWVAADCGTLDAAASAAAPPGLRPFFDEDASGPDDPTPPPPPLDIFDRAVLNLCGAWGSRPRAREFRAMLDRPELRPDLDRLYADLAHAVHAGPVALPRFKDELTAVWFDAGGFRHVFCGEPLVDDLGGLHYRGRYLELQEQGLAGLMATGECRATTIQPPVYTVGVRYLLPGTTTFATACPKGYAYDLGARDLLVAATRAFRQRQRGGMCLAEVEGSDGLVHTAVLVVQNDAIRTFYADATPACNGGGPLSRCRCER